MHFPTSIHEISPEWLTASLQAEGLLPNNHVVGARVEAVGAEAGFLSLVGRVQVDYSEPESDAPSTFIVKLQPTSANESEHEQRLHAFTREIRFYREVAPTAPLRLAKIYGTPEQTPHAALIMEDLSFARMGDQVVGMHTDQVKVTARTIARLHARYWNNEAVAALDWMPEEDGFDRDFADQWPHFEDMYDSFLPSEAKELGQQLCTRMPEVTRRISTRPKTIVHQDLRADNMAFFDGPAGEEVVIFDWQVAVRSIGGFDIARLLGGSEPPEERAGHQFEVLRAWHDALRDGGVRDYTWEDAIYDFRLGALSVLCMPVHFCADPPPHGSRTEALFRAIATRLFRSALETEAIRALD